MPGQLIRAVSRRLFDFTGLANSVVVRSWVTRGLDLSQYREVDLVVRVHSIAINNPGALGINIYADGPTPQDPTFDPLYGSLAVISIDSTTQAPSLLVVSTSQFANLNSPSCSLVITAAAGNPASTSIRATISVDLVLKS